MTAIDVWYHLDPMDTTAIHVQYKIQLKAKQVKTQLIVYHFNVENMHKKYYTLSL